MAEAIPKTWDEARALVADRIQSLTDSSAKQGSRIGELERAVADLRRTIKTATWIVSSVVALACLIGSTAVIQATRIITTDVMAPAALSQTERVEEIADILYDIGTGPGERRQDGRPTVAAVRRALPMVRGITAAEIQSACLMVPDACRVP